MLVFKQLFMFFKVCCSIELLDLASLKRVLLMLQTSFTLLFFTKQVTLMRGANHTEPFPSVRVSWVKV